MDIKSNDLVSSDRLVASGCLRLLSVEALKVQIGARWQARVDQMKFVVESIIKRHLQRGQTFYQANDSTYVIIFDFDAEARAEHICKAISREIVERLLGSAENKAEDLAVEMRVASMPASQVQGGRLAGHDVERHFAGAPPQVISPKGLEADPLGSINAAAQEKITQSQQQLESPAARWRSIMLDQLGRVAGRPPDNQGAAARHGNAPQRDPETLGISFRYLPFWAPASKAFLCHRLDPYIRLEDGGLTGSDHLHRRIDDPEIVRAVDTAALAKALADLKAAVAHGHKYVVVVPLHSESLLTDKDRVTIITQLELQTEPIPKLVVLEISNSEHLRSIDLTRHVWSLHKLCRRVVLRHDLDQLPWIQAQHLPPHSVGVSTIVPSPTTPERTVIARMDAFVDSSRKHGFETYIYGLRTRSLAFAAIGAGFNHVSGEAISARTSEVGPLTSKPMDDLFGR
jgi:hypothetical protein